MTAADRSEGSGGQTRQQIAILGLGKAGKTVIGNYLATGVPTTDFRPTLGVNFSNIIINQIKHQLLDYPGQKSLRHSWESYLDTINIILFVVDASDPLVIPEIDLEFRKLAKKPSVVKSPIFFLFHKVDLAESEQGLAEFKHYFNQLYFTENLCTDVQFFETTIYRPESLDLVKKVMELKLLENFNRI